MCMYAINAIHCHKPVWLNKCAAAWLSDWMWVIVIVMCVNHEIFVWILLQFLACGIDSIHFDDVRYIYIYCLDCNIIHIETLMKMNWCIFISFCGSSSSSAFFSNMIRKLYVNGHAIPLNCRKIRLYGFYAFLLLKYLIWGRPTDFVMVIFSFCSYAKATTKISRIFSSAWNSLKISEKS